MRKWVNRIGNAVVLAYVAQIWTEVGRSVRNAVAPCRDYFTNAMRQTQARNRVPVQLQFRLASTVPATLYLCSTVGTRSLS